MKRYTKAQFLKDVAAEARALKKNATKRELEGLAGVTIDPNGRNRCVYGRMTGDCRSNRAKELINKCCPRFIENPKTTTAFESFSNLQKYINGKKVELSLYRINYFSSIETYIFLPKAKNENLIAYLRGERKDLVL